MKVIVDNRDGIHNIDSEYIDIDLVEAKKILDSLDGQKHTLLCMERDDGWIMNIGGGKEFFVVTLSSNQDENLTLFDPNGSESVTVELCAGGQYADYPSMIVTDAVTAKNALESFFLRNEMNLSWQ